MRSRKTSLTKSFIDAQALAVITTKDGTLKFFRQGRLHRDKGPALVTKGGSQEWWRDGKRHRDGDRPAIEHANGDKVWYRNGVKHRDVGPAVICANGARIWYRDGKRLDSSLMATFDPVKIRKLRPKNP